MSRISSPIFVGRVAELEALGSAWSDVCAGAGRLCLIYGEAGIGKTRLVDEFANRVSSMGGVLHRGRCLDVGEGMLPFGPVAEVIRSLIAGHAVDAGTRIPSGAAEALAAFQPGSSSPSRRRQFDDPLTGQGRLFAGVAEVLSHVAANLPRVVVIEDAHWLDPASRDMIRFLTHALRDAPVMFIVTVRDDMGRVDSTARMLADLEREPHAARLDLPRFTTSEVADQLLGILNHAPAEDLVRSVHARSGGNPFFTEEVVALDIPSGTSVPPSLRDMLLSHLAGADAIARRVLDAASVGGRWVPDDHLRTVVAVDAQAFNLATHALVGAHFLIPEDRPEGSGLAFRHALVRDAVYDDLLPAERRGWHAAWADIGDRHPPAAAAMADHLAAAGATDRAALVYIAGGEFAEQAHAYAEAVRLFERAAALLAADQRGTVTEAALLERLAICAEASGRRGRAIEVLQSAVKLPGVQEDPELAGRLLRQLAELAMFAGLDDVAADALSRGEHMLDALPTCPEAARLLATRSMALLLGGDLPASRLALDAAHRMADRNDLVANSRIGHVRALLVAADDLEDGVTALHEAERMAGANDLLGIQLQAGIDRSKLLVTLGQFQVALRSIERVVGLAAETGTGSWVFAACASLTVECLSALGRWTEIEPLIADVERSERGYLVRLSLALHLLDRGWLEEAVVLAERGLAAIPTKTHGAENRIGRARGAFVVAATASDQEAMLIAANLPDDLVGEDDLAADLALRGIQAGAVILRSGVSPPAILRATKDLRRRLRALAARPGLAASRPIQGCELTATAEMAGHDGVDPIQAWERATAAWRDLGWLHRVAYCRYREGEARLVAGRDRRLADVSVREAHDISVVLGAEPLRREIESLARRARISLEADRGPSEDKEPQTVATPADPHGLTTRELEVLSLLISGRTNREIGAMLFISPKTAGVHVSNILGKFGASNRVEAASIAHRLGMAEVDAAVAVRV